MYVTVQVCCRQWQKDLMVPLFLTAHEMLCLIEDIYRIGLQCQHAQLCYAILENPVALFCGQKTLQELGVRNGSILTIPSV